MRAYKSWCMRPVKGALAVCVLALGASAYGQEIEWVPVSSTGPAVINGNEITVSAGGLQVQFDIFISGWAEAPEAPALGAFQATVVSADLLGENASPPNPGVNLSNPAQVSCSVDGDCASGFCGALGPGFCADEQPAFQVGKTCLADPSVFCSRDAQCSGSPAICVDNPDFITSGQNCQAQLAVSIPPSGNFEFIGACSAEPLIDPGTPRLAGSIRIDVPPNAKGTYTITFNDDGEKTFLNDGVAIKIPGLLLTSGAVTIEIGRCCFGLGGAEEGCTDDLLATECAGLPGPRLFEPGVNCPDSGGPACAECLSTDPTACQDPTAEQAGGDNLCTSNVCVPFPGGTAGACVNLALFDTAADCCDPDVGAGSGLSTIDDFDDCTADSCDAGTGVVSNDPAGAGGEECDDGLGCTLDDTCDGENAASAGGCVGFDVNTQACTTTADCEVGECGSEGLCVCTEDTPLCVDILGKVCEGTTIRCQDDSNCDVNVACVGTDLPDGNCFDEGGTVSTAVAMGAGSAFVTGAQVMVEYDPSCLDLDAGSVGPCAGTVFSSVIDLQIDEDAGTIFYAATVDVLGGVTEGTRGPEDILCMEYTKLAGCDECDLCLTSVSTKKTKLTNDEGNTVPLLNCGCSKAVRTNGVIDLDAPGGEDTNSDCNRKTAEVTWSTPSASDSCDGALTVSCLGESAFATVPQSTIDRYVFNGGDIAQGQAFFLCSASNTCGDVARAVWSVNVSDRQSIDVEVQLSPTMNPGVFSRAITFELWGGEVSCNDDATEVCEVLEFGGPLNFEGHASASLKIPKGNYSCITARDALHTLRSSAQLECDGKVWSAIFKNDPLLGGNWLVGGNLDGAKDGASSNARNVIDIDDFGQFIACIAGGDSFPFPGNTDCSTPHRHCDVNADGEVDGLDYSFILENFLASSKDACCPGQGAGEIVGREEVTLKELRREGNFEAAVADLNKDGVINIDDMAAYMQGVRPASSVRTYRKGDARSSR